MNEMYFHPVWQMAASLIALYALWLGWARVRSLHLGRAASFKRRRHIIWGQTAIYAWLAGVAGGMIQAHEYWNGWLKTGGHAWVGMIMTALMAWGLASGLYMARRPERRTVLPLLHGIGNAGLVGLALVQFFSGRTLLEQIMF